MRPIDNRHIELPEGWQRRAQNAREAVEAGICSINNRSSVWTDLKGALAELSYEKCWYCEAKQERSDDAVDHFRPKNRVAECDTHDGYTWLAFNEENYRYSCTFCNCRRKGIEDETKGKGDSFPLINEDCRWYRPEDTCLENPKTIDPCKAGEPGWLDWRDDGVPVPKYPEHELKNTKAECAIHLYHLDHPGACEARLSIAINIKSWMEEADVGYQRLGTNDNTAEDQYNSRCRDILKTINPHAPYSTFARRIVSMRRGEFEWIDDLI